MNLLESIVVLAFLCVVVLGTIGLAWHDLVEDEMTEWWQAIATGREVENT